MKNLTQAAIKSNSNILSCTLAKVIASPTLDYSQICKAEYQGLYIIFDDDQVLYIGKTDRTGKVRMQELAADFRSHTLNKKLLAKILKDLGFVFKTLSKETKKEWIDQGILTREHFVNHQREVNQYIRSGLKFKFFSQSDERMLTRLEHFAIAIFDPVYND
jgi:hypothetical protein